MDPFDDPCNSLPTAHAGSDHAKLFIKSLKIIDILDRKLTTSTTQRMTQGNGAPVDINFLGIEPGLLYYGQRLRGKASFNSIRSI